MGKNDLYDIHLPVCHEWFVAFMDGDKAAEYREINPTWVSRLMKPTEKRWGGDFWRDTFGRDMYAISPDLYVKNVEASLRMGIITYKNFWNMVLTDGYPCKDDENRHYRVRWVKTDIGCVNPKWAWPDTPADKKFFRIWSRKAISCAGAVTDVSNDPNYECQE